MWSIPDAKAKLSEVLRIAKTGQPQQIGANDPCYVISAEQYRRSFPDEHLGKWLVEHAPRGAEIELPSRSDPRGDPFGDNRKPK